MSEKKRTTVTTIETHEVWVLRRAVPEPAEAAEMITTLETAQSDADILPSSELTNESDTSTEKEP